MRPEHDQQNWHLMKVGMSNTEIVVNIGLTLVTCGVWLPVAAIWFVAVSGRQGWVYVPPGQPIPGSKGLPAVPLVVLGCVLVVGVMVLLMFTTGQFQAS